MTTSNPVVPRLDAALQPRAQQGWSRKHWRITSLNLWPLSDLITIASVATLARPLLSSVPPDSAQLALSIWPLLTAFACMSLFWILGIYSSLPGPMNLRETEQLLRGMCVVAVATALLASHADFSAIFGVIAISIVTALLLVVQRGLARVLLSSRPERPRVLLYLCSLDAELLKTLHTISGHSLEVAGLLYDSASELPEGCERSYALIGGLDDLEFAAHRVEASHVLVVGGDAGGDDIRSVLDKCQRLNLRCSILLDPRIISSGGPTYTFMHELPVVPEAYSVIETPASQLKRAIDLLIAFSALAVALPIGLLVGVLIRLDSCGPIFFRQERIGKDGRTFHLLKFRTMHTWAPSYQRSPASDTDPRITPVGRLLRRFSLDELPQLLNVLKGDMSLVGPRPEMPFVVEQYSDAARVRLSVRPGITGIWQISRARSLPIHHSLHYDLFYIKHQNIFLDAAILLRTFGAVIRGIGAA